MENNILSINLDDVEGTFYYTLSEYGIFNVEQFTELMDYVFNLNTTIDDASRLKQAVLLWEIGFLWEQRKANHYDANDVFNITNINDDQMRQTSKIFYYACNWFTYGKELEKEYLRFGKW
nr:hypothetical protein [uncultured Draconibacterium sp.]